jgi:NADPH2 dehydrogenase
MAVFRSANMLRDYLEQLQVSLPFDETVESGPEAPLAQPYVLKDGFKIGNRFCIQPMEGWDSTATGQPSELTQRRWEHFGRSGAKLIWGGEAVAVRHEGRANPNQLWIHPGNLAAISGLRKALVAAHEARHGTSQDLLIGLQLTHSGRYAKPNDKVRLEPRILYHHPYLDKKIGLPPDYPILTDGEIEGIIADFIRAACLAQEAGYDFVDIKHCHGYLGHEFLSAIQRPGSYGGSFENRTRFLREVVAGIRSAAPGLRMGVRLSAFDQPPYSPDGNGVGVPVTTGDYQNAFGADPESPLNFQLAETIQFLSLLERLQVELVNLTAGSPYYNPHIQRPAYFPPSDGYGPPEDPLAGVARQVNAAAELKSHFPGLCLVGSAYSYLQEWLPNVAQYNIRTGRIDFVGLGRMVLSYPEMPADTLAGKPLDRKHICRTFSDCTTAPRKGFVSGCYPLDELYKARPEAEALKTSTRAEE